MSTYRFLVLVTLASIPGTLMADATKPALPERAGLPFETKNTSTFAVTPGVRNPFVPIGWKGAAIQQVVSKKGLAPADAFRVSSILVGSPSLAVINGKSYEEGQMIRMPKPDPKSKTPPVRAKLFRIGDGVVQIQVEDQVITVPLKRGSLNEIQPDTPLNPDAEQ